MFQNSVLSVLQSESDPHSDTTRWGENEQVEETATDSDHDEHTDRERKQQERKQSFIRDYYLST